jgi:DNA-binding beta-propeller fold protein YncE
MSLPSDPREVAVSPDGRRLYVSTRDAVLVLDAAPVARRDDLAADAPYGVRSQKKSPKWLTTRGGSAMPPPLTTSRKAGRCGRSPGVTLRRWVAAVLVLSAVAPACSVHAATVLFFVNSQLDAPDAAPGNGACATASPPHAAGAAVQEASFRRRTT